MADPLGHDLSAIKRIDSYKNRDVQTRTVLLAVVAAGASWILSDPVFLLWFAGYQLLFSLYVWRVAAAPRRVSSVQFVMIGLLGLTSFLFLLSVCLYLYAMPTSQMHYGALLLYVSVAMNTLALRVRGPYLFLMDTAALYVAAAGFVAIEVWRSGLSTPTYLIAFGIVMFCVYHGFLIAEMYRARVKEKAAYARQIGSEHQRAIGQISAGIAHDFNNLLTVVLGNLELSGQARNDADRAQFLSEAETAAQRGATLTGQLLAFARKAPLNPAPVTLEALRGELAPLADRMLGRRHRLQIGETAGVPALYADSATLLAVLLNLILNAKEAMPEGGTIWLDAEEVLHDGRDMICLRINDTGAGIAAKIRGQVFEPFFSTKPPGQGSGLGLPMALGFAEQSGGDIEITSTEGEGTEVALYLPRARTA